MKKMSFILMLMIFISMTMVLSFADAPKVYKNIDNKGVNLVIDGKQISNADGSMLHYENNRLFVNINVFKELGYDIWSTVPEKAMIQNDGFQYYFIDTTVKDSLYMTYFKRVNLPEPELYISDGVYVGKLFTPTIQPKIYNNNIYIAANDLSLLLYSEIKWDAKTKIVTIDTSKPLTLWDSEFEKAAYEYFGF